MQGDKEQQFVGEIQTPQSVTINTGQQAAMAYGAQPVQPIMQQNVMYIQMPKFRHPTRIISTVLVVVGILVYFLFFVFGIRDRGVHDIGYLTCCMFFNAAFVCEIVFYYNMMQHNQSYGQGTTWAITNIVLGVLLTVVGLFLALGALALVLDL